MMGLRSKVKCIGFYVAPDKYKKHAGLYVMSREGIKKVAAFTNQDMADLFLDVLTELFENPTTDWSMIGPCGDWTNEMRESEKQNV